MSEFPGEADESVRPHFLPPDGSVTSIPAALPEPPDVREAPRRRIWLLLVAGLVVLALAAWAIMRVVNQPGDAASPGGIAGPSVTPAPSAPWRGPLQLGDPHMMATPSIVTGDMMIGYDGRGNLIGVDLVNLRIAWTVPLATDYWDGPFGDDTGIAIILDEQLRVLDPHTGATIGQTQLTPRPAQQATSPVSVPPTMTAPVTTVTPTRQTTPPTWDVLDWAGDGLVLTIDEEESLLCVRAMRDPSTCLWYTSDLWTPKVNWWRTYAYGTSGHVFGDGKWINTGKGVRVLATGDPAPFGTRVGATPDGPIYYAGPSEDRVFRMTPPGPSGSGVTGTAQPWDVVTDQPVSPAVPADLVHTAAGSDVYIAQTGDPTSDNPSVAHSWSTGQELWRHDGLYGDWCLGPCLIGGVFVSYWQHQDLLVLDVATGQQLWSGTNQPLVVVSGNRLIIATDRVTAFDCNAGLREVWSVAPPERFLRNIGNLFATPGHVFLITTSNSLWELDA